MIIRAGFLALEEAAGGPGCLATLEGFSVSGAADEVSGALNELFVVVLVTR